MVAVNSPAVNCRPNPSLKLSHSITSVVGDIISAKVELKVYASKPQSDEKKLLVLKECYEKFQCPLHKLFNKEMSAYYLPLT